MLRTMMIVGAAAIALSSNALDAQSAPGADLIDYNGKPVYGVHAAPDYDVAGTYMFDDFGKPTEPRVELHADGTGCWANHGRPCVPMKWWFESDKSGKIFSTTEDGVTRFAFFFQQTEAANGKAAGSFSGYTFYVNPAQRLMSIAGERNRHY